MRIHFGAILLAASVSFSSGAQAEAQQLIFSHVVSPDTPKGKMALMFKDIVEEKMPGRFEVVVYDSAELMSDEESVDAISEGRIHFAAPALSKFDGYTSSLKVFDLPFLFPNMEKVNEFQSSDTGKRLLNSMTGDNVLGLGYLHNGLKQLSADRRFESPQDLAGLRFRVINSDVLKDQFQAVNAEPVPMSFPATFPALRDGVVDGQENTWSNIYSMNFYQYQPYMMESNHGVLGYMFITNNEFWSELTEEERRLFRHAASVSLRYGNAVAVAKSRNDKAAIKRMKSVALLEPTPEQLARWQTVMRPIWAKYEPEIGKTIVDEAIKISSR
ncbi:DctP family TRAP transporter solute-binding subunit [Marinobacter confluentis]|uniref:DctP family TRAP transporter solute-binding subunit n=1 Tax=Marinobacter confluentis TaxID=1697557 RepID=A0A4Z1C2A7_9GAMM|nr:DctP family TRAP transporter solute-binding subunit [Marinobacter confluentis]TGN39182.1 DctP family TRAP transporter solute-binding subunit [Marinobacter confluentis]